MKNRTITVAINILIYISIVFYSSCQNVEKSRIENIYTIDGKQGAVLYDTDLKKSQVLIQDNESVFFVMGTSKNNEWVELSKMPAGPDVAYGVNEKKLLMYVPQKRLICHPRYGNGAYLIGINSTNNLESILWYLDTSDKIDTIPITQLTISCLKECLCNCDSEE